MQWKETEILELLVYLIDPWPLTHNCSQYRIDCISCINDSYTVSPFFKKRITECINDS